VVLNLGGLGDILYSELDGDQKRSSAFEATIEYAPAAKILATPMANRQTYIICVYVYTPCFKKNIHSYYWLYVDE